MILELLAYGFFSAFGWWGANHYVIEPYFPPAIEKKAEPKEAPVDLKKDEEPAKEKE